MRLPILIIFALLLGASGAQPAPAPHVAPHIAQQSAPQKAAPRWGDEAPSRPIPDASLYPLLLAEFALRQQEYELALEQYMEQARVLRDPAISAHTTRLAQFLNRGPEALEASRLWLELEPDNPNALLLLATAQWDTQQLDAARASFERLLTLGSHRDTAHHYLGRIADEQQRPGAALHHHRQVRAGHFLNAAINRVAELLADDSAELGNYFDALRGDFPQLAEQLWNAEANKLVAAGRDPEARQRLALGLEQFPSSTTLRYTRSLLHERLGDLAQAERDLRHIIAAEPDNATALNALGYTLANRTQRYAEAEPLLRRALELSPEEPSILDSMGWLLYRQGQHEAALDYLQRAHQALPDPEVAAHLGEVLWVLGRQEAALPVWRAALAQHPEHEVLLETLRRLGVEGIVGTGLPAPQ